MIYDSVINSGDKVTWGRMKATYGRGYLNLVLGGYPDHLDESIEKGEI